MPFSFTKCAFCEYSTNIKCNLKRHQNAKHKKEIQCINKILGNEQNVTPSEQNVTPNEQNVTSTKLYCQKCNKSYKTKKHLINHEAKCKGIDELTCPKCMVSFTNRHHKSRHINADKCKARSIIHARPPNIQNVSHRIIQNAETIQNINTNINNIQINNFGSERIDHISDDDIKRILQSGINTVPLYIEKKHFDKKFPENKNIKYTNDNKCHVMEDNSWKEKDIGLLSDNLIQDNTEVLLMYCDKNEIKLLNEIKDTDIYDNIRNKLFIIYNKTNNQKYNKVLTKIKELIKSSTIDDYQI
jgi:hypothetical protein